MKAYLTKRELKSLKKAFDALPVGGVDIIKTEGYRATIVVQKLSSERMALTIYSEQEVEGED